MIPESLRFWDHFLLPPFCDVFVTIASYPVYQSHNRVRANHLAFNFYD